MCLRTQVFINQNFSGKVLPPNNEELGNFPLLLTVYNYLPKITKIKESGGGGWETGLSHGEIIKSKKRKDSPSLGQYPLGENLLVRESPPNSN